MMMNTKNVDETVSPLGHYTVRKNTTGRNSMVAVSNIFPLTFKNESRSNENVNLKAIEYFIFDINDYIGPIC